MAIFLRQQIVWLVHFDAPIYLNFQIKFLATNQNGPRSWESLVLVSCACSFRFEKKKTKQERSFFFLWLFSFCGPVVVAVQLGGVGAALIHFESVGARLLGRSSSRRLVVETNPQNVEARNSPNVATEWQNFLKKITLCERLK